MNLELNEAGMTFLVGAFVILAAEAISYYFFDRHLMRFFEGRLGLDDAERPAAITTGVFVGLSFALGLLVEDAGFKYSDPLVYRPFRVLYAKLHLAAGAHDDSTVKGAMQHSALISELHERGPKLTRLGKAVFASGIFAALLGRDGHATQLWATEGGVLPQRADATSKTPRFAKVDDDIAAVFYFAKNRVYNTKHYFEELSRIQARLEFSSTIATISLIFVFVALLSGVVAIPLTRQKGDIATRLKNVAGVIAVFTGIYVLGYVAYVHESEEFNKRVFGYYDSMLRAARLTPLTASSNDPLT
jgi:hypothetical protein